jgi:hypothetical protein
MTAHNRIFLALKLPRRMNGTCNSDKRFVTLAKDTGIAKGR